MSALQALRCLALAALSVSASIPVDAGPPFHDPLDSPAETLSGALAPGREPVLAVASAGEHLVAVGLRGLIARSDDGGLTWRQVPSPVQSDLAAVCFVSTASGWAAGHDGVILNTADGGATWVRQYDGRRMQSEGPQLYQRRIEAGEVTLKPVLDELILNTKNGATLPYLGIYFENKDSGYAVGSFGMIARTVDGGRNWVPWLEHVDNPEFLNLNDIRRVGDEIYIVGEKGTVWRLDHAQQRFVAVPTGYSGSFFGVTGNAGVVLAFGLGGTVYRSTDHGTSWQPVESGTKATLTAGALAPDGRRLLLASTGGELLDSSDQGQSFRAVAARVPMMLSSLGVLAGGSVVLAGYQGIVVQALPAANGG
jgi:photosystem II stability/assembly factor-like uncharacterized protein